MNRQNQLQHPHQGQQILSGGKPLSAAEAALILIHGRGASAYDIIGLGMELDNGQYTLLAPQAANNTWYPYSFLSPLDRNEPYLTSALQSVADLVAHVEENGISAEKIILAGFSQGACLISEFAARNTRRYGGLLAFSGGLIGPPGTARDYPGSLEGTPVFIGCSDIDAHIPVERVHETAEILRALGAEVHKKIYPGMAHTINQDELDQAQKIVNEVTQ
ncbi:MAG: dienelactone hydrolase family protein [Candidatus Promineifilaceae bacterium]|nr:dienelactone hydrolase family protein [Candidatus Promineifilaceae bacterium]